MTSPDSIGPLFSAIIAVFLALFSPVFHPLDYIPRLEDYSATVMVTPDQPPSVPPLFDSFTDAIRTRLRTDERYQQAAVAGALETTPSEAPNTVPIEAALVNIFGV